MNKLKPDIIWSRTVKQLEKATVEIIKEIVINNYQK